VRVRAIADEFPTAFCSLEFATGSLNCGVGMMIYLEVPKDAENERVYRALILGEG
jgi:hypothetical protein